MDLHRDGCLDRYIMHGTLSIHDVRLSWLWNNFAMKVVSVSTVNARFLRLRPNCAAKIGKRPFTFSFERGGRGPVEIGHAFR
jgi:hypothetical protein